MVDVYPTLAALAGLPSPQSLGELVNGTSLEPVFDSPGSSNVKQAAFSQFAKVSYFNITPHFSRQQTELMGYTVRVKTWRYTAWFAFDKVNIRPLLDQVIGRELYSHHGDTGLWLDFAGENVNVVNETANEALVSKLHQQILDYIRLK